MASDLQNVEIVEREGGILLQVKVVPGASRTRVAGAWGKALKVAVAAPPTGGQANQAVCELLGQILRVRRADVGIQAGHSQPLKRVFVAGVTAKAARERVLQGR